MQGLLVPQDNSLHIVASVETQPVMNGYRVEEGLFPGSGRMMRTFRVSHRQAESTAVMKAMWVVSVSSASSSYSSKEA
jgi:hypothetical protein